MHHAPTPTPPHRHVTQRRSTHEPDDTPQPPNPPPATEDHPDDHHEPFPTAPHEPEPGEPSLHHDFWIIVLRGPSMLAYEKGVWAEA